MKCRCLNNYAGWLMTHFTEGMIYEYKKEIKHNYINYSLVDDQGRTKWFRHDFSEHFIDISEDRDKKIESLLV